MWNSLLVRMLDREETLFIVATRPLLVVLLLFTWLYIVRPERGRLRGILALLICVDTGAWVELYFT